MAPTENSTAPSQGPGILLPALGLLGLAAHIVALWAVQPYQFNVVTYRSERITLPAHWPSVGLAVVALGIAIGHTVRAGRETGGAAFIRRGLSLLAPLLLSAPLAVCGFVDASPSWIWVLLHIIGAGWALARTCRSAPSSNLHDSDTLPEVDASQTRSHLALVSIVLLIGVLTLTHTRIQINFFEHFMLGHADFGHYTEEFKNALLGRGLRSDSFPNTRLGWHFSPLLYVMVPGYWLWPSPVYLMVCSALFVHLPAIPAYFFARRRSGSILVGWLFAVAWLLLPSCSRMVYSNTYGFQWIYAMMTPLGIMMAMATARRWRTCAVMIVLILLAKETTAAIIFGLGLSLALFTERRVIGAAIAALSVAYAVVCIHWIIPHFAASGRYERMELFGSLGGSFAELAASAFTRPGEFFGRLARPEAGYFLLMLLVPMAALPLKSWRIALATAPALLLILLMENPDWMSIKFWHQAMVLPVLFFAGIAALGDRRRARALAMAAVVCALWSHYFFGFSPVAKAAQVYANNPALHVPDPRLAFIRHLRETIPPDRTILATERLAAHFTDYHRLYTGKRPLLADFVVIDRDDRWDTSGLPRRAAEFLANPSYTRYDEFHQIIVFARRPEAPTDQSAE